MWEDIMYESVYSGIRKLPVDRGDADLDMCAKQVLASRFKGRLNLDLPIDQMPIKSLLDIAKDQVDRAARIRAGKEPVDESDADRIYFEMGNVAVDAKQARQRALELEPVTEEAQKLVEDYRDLCETWFEAAQSAEAILNKPALKLLQDFHASRIKTDENLKKLTAKLNDLRRP